MTDPARTLSPAQRLAVGLIRSYQLTLAPLFSGSCRFLPSCSTYATEAIALHGVLRGSILTFRRLGRCHPLAEPGADPVPLPPRRY